MSNQHDPNRTEGGLRRSGRCLASVIERELVVCLNLYISSFHADIFLSHFSNLISIWKRKPRVFRYLGIYFRVWGEGNNEKGPQLLNDAFSGGLDVFCGVNYSVLGHTITQSVFRWFVCLTMICLNLGLTYAEYKQFLNTVC